MPVPVARRFRSAWPYAAAALVAVAVHAWLWDASYAVFTASVDFNDGALEDFMGPYLETGRAVLETGEPGPGFFYTPTFALALTPVAALNPGVASWVWLSFELLASGVLVGLGLALVRERPPWLGPVYLLVALLSFPLAHNLHWGQVSVPIAALVLGALAADLRGRARGAALLLACAASIKLYPALFLLVPLVREDWRTVSWTGAWALTLLALLPAAVLGPEATVEFYRAALAALERAQAPGGAWHGAANQQVLPAVLGRWTGIEAPLLFGAVGSLWAVANLFVARSLARRGTRAGTRLAYAAIALSLPLVVAPSWPHYFVWLPFVQLALAREGLRGERRDLWTLALVGASALLSSVLAFRAAGDWEAYGGGGWLLGADLVALAALYRVARRDSS